jgi:hypothetical protein
MVHCNYVFAVEGKHFVYRDVLSLSRILKTSRWQYVYIRFVDCFKNHINNKWSSANAVILLCVDRLPNYSDLQQSFLCVSQDLPCLNSEEDGATQNYKSHLIWQARFLSCCNLTGNRPPSVKTLSNTWKNISICHVKLYFITDSVSPTETHREWGRETGNF